MSALLTDDSIVDLHPLHIGTEEDGAVEVGRADTGMFVALPPEGVALLRLLADHLPMAEVRRRFGDSYGEPPDLDDFVAGLHECGFIRAVDGVPWPEGDDERGATEADPAASPAGGTTMRGIALLGGLGPERLRWLLSRPLLLVFAGVWLAVPALMLADPSLAPRPSDALLYHRVLPNALLVAVIAWTLVMLHEFAHALAARARGCTGRFSVGRRLVFLVGQTELSDVRTIARRQRYAPYLAGMTWDLIVVLGCLCCELAAVGGQLPRTVTYTVALTFIYQFSVFMRTDIYYVIVNALRLGDLMGDTRRLLANAVRGLRHSEPAYDLSGVPEREMRIIRWYCVYYLLGSSTVIAGSLLLSVPALVRMLRIAADGMASGPAAAGFWDGAGFVALVAFQFGTLGYVGFRDHRRTRAGTAATAV
ncbi:hypothetical protein QMK19_35985 [Streptomyces sp. H10-C2]|uniref:hypothetical protein n=1 Tax=unclassified Streptomyces TaxID=2593676 RepID=UPI0024B96B29|nr:MULTISPECIES: hypothetical protein [unclassified Streptomyces]MDJ0344119.1 hypothetical protein [Streptomyces sp. PH10-H1]MDJ0374875.1 hypothetical protein [Streptomyces sp. H10-C2]